MIVFDWMRSWTAFIVWTEWGCFLAEEREVSNTHGTMFFLRVNVKREQSNSLPAESDRCNRWLCTAESAGNALLSWTFILASAQTVVFSQFLFSSIRVWIHLLWFSLTRFILPQSRWTVFLVEHVTVAGWFEIAFFPSILATDWLTALVVGYIVMDWLFYVMYDNSKLLWWFKAICFI